MPSILAWCSRQEADRGTHPEREWDLLPGCADFTADKPLMHELPSNLSELPPSKTFD
jgi:hypothetical protein